VSYDWSSADTSRAVPGAATVSSDYGLNSLILDAVASYDARLGQGLVITPAVGITHVATDREAARESGSAAFALDIDGDSHSATFIDGTIALRGPASSSVRPWLEIGVRHHLDGELPLASAGFVGAAARFIAPGVSREQTVITYGAGFEASVAETVSLFAGYRGESADGSGSNLTGGVRVRF
jgi:outer membrane autotransporter protein